jgi:pyrophosphate--fructose-6-phosphate 1-phosphotransferase
MAKNLHSIRQAYNPCLPSILKSIDRLCFEEKELLHIDSSVQDFFPLSRMNRVVVGSLGLSTPTSPLKVGVIFSGGPAPGGHSLIAGLYDALKKMHKEGLLIGFLNGPEGLVNNSYRYITEEILQSYRHQGGFDLLGSGRFKIETEQHLAGALNAAKQHSLDGIVIIGGDDSNTTAAHLAEYFLHHQCLTKVIGVPKTIDGDLKNDYVPITFGFDTATKVYAQLIGNLSRDLLSTRKGYHFVRLMGRSASHITLECALQTHPNLALISEEKKSLSPIVDEITDLIIKRSLQGKEYGIILIPEGLIETMPDFSSNYASLPLTLKNQLALEPDMYGNLPIAAIETEYLLIELVTQKLKKLAYEGRFNPIRHYFGYEGRSAYPTNFDVHYCYALGYTAAALINHKITGCMAYIKNLKDPVEKWEIGGIPLLALMHFEMRKNVCVPVIAKALVDLQSPAYRNFKQLSDSWKLKDDYQFPGPIQFMGEDYLTYNLPLILC